MLRFRAYDLSLELISALQAPLAAMRLRSRDEADQLQRAAHSVARNIAEGSGRFGKDRVHFRRIAYGSLLEAECTLDIAAAAGWVAPDAEARALIKQLGAMLWPLVK